MWACLSEVWESWRKPNIGIKEISDKIVSVKVFEVSERDSSWGKLWFNAISNTVDYLKGTNFRGTNFRGWTCPNV